MSLLPKDAAERKAIPLYSGLVRYFPRALVWVAKVSFIGNAQHHPDKPLHWDMAKSSDEPDAMLRHLFEHAAGDEWDGDTLELAKHAWRSLAMLERHLLAKGPGWASRSE